MEVTLEIRRATAADLSVLAHHRVSMFRDMRAIAPELETALGDSAIVDLRDALESGEYVAWLVHPVDHPHQVVAGAGVQLRRLLPRPDDSGRRVVRGREGIVLNMYVERDYRRRGIARRLMQAIIAWAREGHVARLVLHASHEGRPLYEAMGFVNTSEMRFTASLTAFEEDLRR